MSFQRHISWRTIALFWISFKIYALERTGLLGNITYKKNSVGSIRNAAPTLRHCGQICKHFRSNSARTYIIVQRMVQLFPNCCWVVPIFWKSGRTRRQTKKQVSMFGKLLFRFDKNSTFLRLVNNHSSSRYDMKHSHLPRLIFWGDFDIRH